jgi:hypothetical protein
LKPVNPLGQTEPSDPGALPRTELSLPPQMAPVTLPDARPPTERAPLWPLVVALLAGVATALGAAYALR